MRAQETAAERHAPLLHDYLPTCNTLPNRVLLFPQVYLFGGVVLSWKMASGDEVLYVRPDAKFDG